MRRRATAATDLLDLINKPGRHKYSCEGIADSGGGGSKLRRWPMERTDGRWDGTICVRADSGDQKSVGRGWRSPTHRSNPRSGCWV